MKVFCDIDGVLTDFPRAYNERFGLSIPLEKFNEEEFPAAVGKDARQIDAELDSDFWANLPWMRHGKEFLACIERIFGPENICLLSFPSYSPDGPRGKIEWVKRELPQYEMRLILALDKRFCASRNAILFDDKFRNVTEFRAAGGHSILVPAPWNFKEGECTIDEFIRWPDWLYLKLPARLTGGIVRRVFSSLSCFATENTEVTEKKIVNRKP